MFIFLQHGKKGGQKDTEQAVWNMNRAIPWVLNCKKYTFCSTCLDTILTEDLGEESWKASRWQMITRLLHMWSDPLEGAKEGVGWCQKKVSHSSNLCWSMVMSLSPPLLSRFLDDYSLTNSQQPPAILALRPPHVPFQENTHYFGLFCQ